MPKEIPVYRTETASTEYTIETVQVPFASAVLESEYQNDLEIFLGNTTESLHLLQLLRQGLVLSFNLSYTYRIEPDWEHAPIGGSPGEIHPISDDDHEDLRAFRKWQYHQNLNKGN